MPDQLPPADPESPRLVITVDHRERPSGLVDALLPLWPAVAVGMLTVGDVHIGRRVLVERKTIQDFVSSVSDGRFFRQLHAMCGESHRPLLVLEGSCSIPAAGLATEALRGILLSVAVGYRIPMLRTMDVHETAIYLARMAAQEERRLASGSVRRSAKAGPLSVLAAVPGVGEERAGALLSHFGNLRSVFTATPDDLRDVEGVGPHTARRITDMGIACQPRGDEPKENR